MRLSLGAGGGGLGTAWLTYQALHFTFGVGAFLSPAFIGASIAASEGHVARLVGPCVAYGVLGVALTLGSLALPSPTASMWAPASEGVEAPTRSLVVSRPLVPVVACVGVVIVPGTAVVVDVGGFQLRTPVCVCKKPSSPRLVNYLCQLSDVMSPSS